MTALGTYSIFESFLRRCIGPYFGIFIVCVALSFSHFPMGAALRPGDLPPSLDDVVFLRLIRSKRNHIERRASHRAPPFVAWRDRLAEIFSVRMVEKSCLATAIYFEARSESTLGQLSVANVIINRTKIPAYPSTVCGVVFQDQALQRFQFSFACDGKSDVPQTKRAWKKAMAIASLLLPVKKKRNYEEFFLFHRHPLSYR